MSYPEIIVFEARLCVLFRHVVDEASKGSEEFVKRSKTRDHFITTGLSEPRLFMIGSEDELKAMGR